MHTGEPLFGGSDSHDQLFKIVRMQGPLPDSLVAKAEKREKFFAAATADKTGAAGGPAGGAAGGAGSFQLKVPPQYGRREDGSCLEPSPAKSLREVIGVDSGGPAGRRLGEKGHSVEHYEAYLDFVGRMLRIDPEERVRPGEALRHPFLQDAMWAWKHAGEQKDARSKGSGAEIKADAEVRPAEKAEPASTGD